MSSPDPFLDEARGKGGSERDDAGAAEDRDARGPSDRSAIAFAVFLTVAGIMHFVVPSFYEKLIPSWAGDPKRAVWLSGWAEIACGGLVALPKSRRVGAWAALVLLVAVYPGNIKMALDAGPPRDAYSIGAWARLPLQIPMWVWAISVARSAKRQVSP